ncbi:MAG: hypothetical protein ACTS3F_10465 [Phycisphaerales bacterium]
MLTHRTRTVRSLMITLAATAAITLAPALAPAQNNAQAVQQRAITAHQLQGGPSQPEEPRFDLRFEGGTVADYLEAIQNASGTRNIVTMHGLDLIPMPRVQLDQVTTGAAVAVLDNTRHTTDEGQQLEVYFRSFEGVYTVRVIEDSRRGMPFPQQQQREREILGTRIHPLAEMIEYGAYPAESILSAIEAALDMSEDSTARLRFHEETRTLFVRANAFDQQTVEAVLEALIQQMDVMSEITTPEQEMRDLSEQIRAEQRRIQSFEQAHADALASMDALRSRIRSLQEHAAENDTEGGVDRALEIELDTAANALQRAAVRAESLEQEINNARSRLSQLQGFLIDLQDRLERPDAER